MPKNLLFEVSPVDPSTGLTTTIRMSLAGGDSNDVLVNSLQYLPVITSGPRRSISMFSEGPAQVSTVQVDHGSITFRIGSQFGNTNWANLAWDGATAQMWVGDRGSTFSGYTLIFTGACGPLNRDGSMATIALLGKEATLDTPLLNSSYVGTGNGEGPATLLGTLKPRCYGTCINVQAVLIDPVYWIYQYHGYGATQGVLGVYENAYPVNATSQGDYATFAALQAATLVAGQWASCKAQGLFRLGGQPKGKITADVQGATSSGTFIDKISTVVPDIIYVSGLTSANVNATSFATFSAKTISLFQTQQVTVGDAARELLRQTGGYLVSDSSGNFRCGDWFGTRTSTLLRTRESTSLGGSLIRQGANGAGLKQLAEPAPLYKVRVGYDRVWSVNSDSEISSAVFDAGTNADAAATAAANAQTTANTASANATTALNQLTNIVSDSVIDRAEKQILIQWMNAWTAEKTGIDSQADGYGIVAEKSTYDTAYTTLNSYLTGLSPSALDSSADTTGITRSTFNTNLQSFLTAKQALLNKIQAVTGLYGYLTVPMISVPANSTGTVSSYTGATGKLVMKYGNLDVTESSTFSATSVGTSLTYTLSNTTGSKGTYTITGGWTENTPATLTITGTYSGNGVTNTVVQTVVISKSLAGAGGPSGLNNQQVFLWQTASVAPSVPSGGTPVGYNFTTGALSNLSGGWTATAPSPTSGNPLYMTVATASSTSTTTTIPNTAWASPVIWSQVGSNGSPGTNVATVNLYQRASSSPAVPSSSVTYTFGANPPISSGLGSWTLSVPTANGFPCYITQATAASSGASDTIATAEWSTPTIWSVDGATISLVASAASFNFVDGVAATTGATITFTATEQNAVETINFTTSPTVTLTGSGLTRTLAVTDFGTNTSVVVTATGATTGAKASCTVTRVNTTSGRDSILIDSDFSGSMGCVTTDTVLPSHDRAGSVRVGDQLVISNPLNFAQRSGTVSYASPFLAPCVRITTVNGIQLDCSESAPIAVEGGECVLAPDLLGMRVPVVDGAACRIEEVVSVVSLGKREIMHITCENDLFLAGRKRGRYLFHHNVKALWSGDGRFDALS